MRLRIKITRAGDGRGWLVVYPWRNPLAQLQGFMSSMDIAPDFETARSAVSQAIA